MNTEDEMVSLIEKMDTKTINRLIDDLESGMRATPRVHEAIRARLLTIRAELVAQLPDHLKPKVH